MNILNKRIAKKAVESTGIEHAAFGGLVLQVLEKRGYGGGDAKQIQGVPRGRDDGIHENIIEHSLGVQVQQ